MARVGAPSGCSGWQDRKNSRYPRACAVCAFTASPGMYRTCRQKRGGGKRAAPAVLTGSHDRVAAPAIPLPLRACRAFF